MLEMSNLTETFGKEIRGRKEDLDALTREEARKMLDEHGALVFREFDCTLEDYEKITKLFSSNFLVHHGTYRGENRLLMNADGTTQTVAPGTGEIPPHVERGYAPPIPDVQTFYCVKPADKGGETTIFDGYEFFSALSPSTQRFFSNNKMRWFLRVPPEAWQRTLQAPSQEQALPLLKQYLSMMAGKRSEQTATCEFDGEELIVDFLTPSVMRSSRRTGQAFSNSSLSWFVHWNGHREIDLRMEDGSEFPSEPLAEALESARRSLIPLRLETGEFVIIDNRTVLHGRLAFEDTNRCLVTRMCYVD